MVKNIKGLKLKIASIIMIVLLLTLELGPFAVKATAQQYNYYSPGIVSVGYDSYNGKNVWYSNATLGGVTAYCLDYTCPAPSGTMTFRSYLSDQGMAVLMNGYPNLTPAQMGVDTVEEAYMATQMALWEVVNRTGESTKARRIFRVENVTPKAGMEDFYNKSKTAAANLVARAKSNPYTSVPTMTIDNANVHLADMNGDALIGPYTVTISGTDASTIKSIRASLVNAPSSAKIVDGNGNEKSSLSNGDTVYIRMSRKEASTSFNIKFESDVDRKVGAIYEKAGQDVQDYVRIDTVPNNMQKELTINWTKPNTLGEIQLVKVDQDDQPVSGAVFNLYNDANELVVDNVSTGSDGKISFYKVPEGNYVLEEVSAPEGYEIKNKTQNVTVKAGETTDVKVVNERVTGKLIITKVDDTNKPIKDVTFEIYDSEGYSVQKIVTDENGKASIDLNYGTYYYKEISAPEGYVMDTTLYKFSVDNENRTFNAKVVNDKVYGSLIIKKTNESNEPIANVKFDILDENNNVVITITTNEKGLAGVKNLAYGKYYYKEVEAPSNVKMDTNEHEFVINTQNQVVTKTVINTTVPESGMLEITKYDSNNNLLSGVEFDILDENDKVVDHIVTDENGKATSRNLGLGTYYYKETKAPSNVKMDTEKHQFVLVQNNQVVKKTVVNENVSKITLIKYDEDHKPLAGVEFNIYDKDKKQIDHIVTNEEGRAETEKEYEAGTYYIQEVKAPEGIKVDDSMIEFELKTDGQNVAPKEIVNYYIKGQLKIYKMISGTDTPLAGAKFEISDANGNVVETLTSDENGVCTSSKLRYGTYYFKEVEAPNGYIKDDNTYQFDVRIDNETIESVVYNTKENLPKTGGFVSSDLMIVLVVTLVSVAGYSIFRALSKKED